MIRTTDRPSRRAGPVRLAAVAVFAVFAGLAAACAAPPAPPVTSSAAKVERVDGMTRLVLIAKAAERIGIKTEPVVEVVTGTQAARVIPYSALIYDTKGETFAYTNPAPLVFIRHTVKVQTIQGDRVFLTDGPPAGSAVVTLGASQLLGIELGVGL